MIDLIVQYRKAKQLAKRINVDSCNMYVDESRVVGEMLYDLDYALTWMRTGNQPNVKPQGTTTKSAYTKRLLLNVNMFPCLDIDTDRQERQLSDYKKQIVHLVLSALSERQLTCFLLHTAHMRTFQEIADELNIKTSTVQKHIERAREKIQEIIEEHKIDI